MYSDARFGQKVCVLRSRNTVIKKKFKKKKKKKAVFLSYPYFIISDNILAVSDNSH